MTPISKFICERWSILKKRERNIPRPWTDDIILQSYRFCNVDREDDTVTRWIADNWRNPHGRDPDLWFAMCVARYVNWPETLAALGYPVPWDAKKFVSVLQARGKRGEKIWTGAYTVSTNGVKLPKPVYVAQMLQALWAARAAIRPVKGDVLAAFAGRLAGYNGVGGFMAGQVVADVKHAHASPLHAAADWWTWACSGPGSRRGLNRVMGRAVDAPWSETHWKTCLGDLLIVVKKELPMEIKKVLDAQNLQNCLCEFDKYERVRLGQGRPRSRYNGIS